VVFARALIVLSLIVVSTAHGAAQVYSVSTTQYDAPTGIAPSTIKFPTHFRARAANDVRYFSRVVEISKATIGRRILTGVALGTGYGLAAMAAMEAAGYIYDRVNGQFGTAGPVNPLDEQYKTYWAKFPNGLVNPNTCAEESDRCTVSDALALWDEYVTQSTGEGSPDCEVNGSDDLDDGRVSMYVECNLYGVRQGAGGFNLIPFSSGSSPLDPQPSIEPLSDDAVADALYQSNPDLLRDAMQPNGIPVETVETRQAADDIARQLASEQGIDPGTVPDTTTTVPDPSTEPDPTTPNEEDLPQLCGYLGPVCPAVESIAEWLQSEGTEPTPPDLPTEVVNPQEVDWQSGLGAGNCPANLGQFSIMGESFEIPSGPACEALTMLRPIVIFSAWLLGSLIVMGGTKQ